MKIATNRFVSVMYDLNTGNEDARELRERATAEHPLEFICGTGAVLPAFEAQLKGLGADDTFRFSLSPESAYGEYDEENVVELPKKIFETDGVFDADYVAEGAVLPMTDSDGFRLNGTVAEVNADTVVMNFNHPLAGETLHFSGRVLHVREATADDVAALHGCGCNCGEGEGSCLCESGECGCEQDGRGCGCGCGCH
ncbi:MAG: FKBP-type peptidyl-prolyl cis-trans isomerase [Tannerella sp.]|nr:FKBP-type peptidyl-prolyl cis-trans isomerase [Tannerella sp.]